MTKVIPGSQRHPFINNNAFEARIFALVIIIPRPLWSWDRRFLTFAQASHSNISTARAKAVYCFEFGYVCCPCGYCSFTACDTSPWACRHGRRPTGPHWSPIFFVQVCGSWCKVQLFRMRLLYATFLVTLLIHTGKLISFLYARWWPTVAGR